MITKKSELISIAQSKLDEITHIAFFSNSGEYTNIDQLSDKYELGRVAVTKTFSNDLAIINFTLDSNTAICPSSDISSATSTTLTLSDASNFQNNNELIMIDYSIPIFKSITNKSGNILTFSEVFKTVPANITSQKAKVVITQFALIKNGESNEGTGEIFTGGHYGNIFKDATYSDIPGQIRFRVKNG